MLSMQYKRCSRNRHDRITAIGRCSGQANERRGKSTMSHLVVAYGAGVCPRTHLLAQASSTK